MSASCAPSAPASPASAGKPVTPPAAEVLADPVGVVAGLLCGAEPGLDRQVASDLVQRVAVGRAKRRRLAQALLDKPSLLTDGRSPAPRVVGNLLIALRRAGAVIISAPGCAECGKQLRSMQRRGQDWYCGVCGPEPEPCTGCGLSRPVSVRDRGGRPRCSGCRHRRPPDPMQILLEVVTAVDPGIGAAAVIAAARAAAPGPGSAAGWRGRCKITPGCSPEQARTHRSLGAPAASMHSPRPGRWDRPACLSALRADHRPGQATRRGAALPQLRGEVPRRAVFALRCRPRGGHPRRARRAAVPLLPDLRPRQPGNVCRLRAAPRRQRPDPRWPAVSGLPAGQDDDLLDLRTLGSRRDLQGHR